MKAKLIRVLREMDNNQFTTELNTYFKYVELLIDPQLNTTIKEGNVEFYIDTLTQDLNSGIVILHEYVDIHYRYIESFEKSGNLLEDGWKLL